jgi:hypothetical protein
MSAENSSQTSIKKQGWSIEVWAGLLAFTLAALVRAGVFKHLPW